MKPSKAIALLAGMDAAVLILAFSFRAAHSATHQTTYLTLYLTFLTTGYHFSMRLAVGEIITVLFRNRDFHYDSPWYQQHAFEAKLYKLLGVKKWKQQMITAKPEQFDIRQRTYQELQKNMTQAEVVHEIIMVMSFLPLCLIPQYGAAGVFIITSVLACLADSLFVMIQRCNRPRVLRLKQKEELKKEKNHV